MMLHSISVAVLLVFAAAPAAPDVFANAGPVPVVKVKVDKANLDQLLKEPRKYVTATLEVGTETWKSVGLHMKGAAGSTRDWSDKPGLTLNSNKFSKGQTIWGMDKFHFNNCVQDGTYLNETIFYDISRDVGLPAARTTHALVELNGRKAGLYLLKEGFDAAFLKRHFKDTTGNLYDGGFLLDIDGGIRLDRGPGPAGDDLKLLVAAAQIPDAKKRMAALDQKLDLEKFYLLWALEILTTDWDGYTRTRNNYRMYHDPKSDKFVMFPHGKDQLFQNPQDGLVHGWNGILARKIYETDEGKKKYHAVLNELAKKYFTTAKLHERADALAPRVKDALNALQPGAGDQYMKGEFKAYKDRLKQRAEYVAREAPKLISPR